MSEQQESPVILCMDANKGDTEAVACGFDKDNIMDPFYWRKSEPGVLDYSRKKDECKNNNARGERDFVLFDFNVLGIVRCKDSRVIKQNGGRRIPVIILTVSGGEHNISKRYDMSVSAYRDKRVGFANRMGVVKRIKEYWYGVAILPGMFSYE